VLPTGMVEGLNPGLTVVGIMMQVFGCLRIFYVFSNALHQERFVSGNMGSAVITTVLKGELHVQG